MILGISSYITSAGLNSVVSAGALGPSFSPKYFLPIYSPTWDKLIRTGADNTYTSAISVSSLNLVGATDSILNTSGVEKIFNGASYSISDKVFVYNLNGVGSNGDATFVSRQNVPSDVNLLNNKPLSTGLSATSISAINSNTLNVTGRYDFNSSEVNNYLNYNPLSAGNIPLSAFYRVTSYSPKVEEQNTVGRFKCRIPASESTFKFNGIALYLTKTDLQGYDDNGNGISFFNFSPVLFAVILFDQAQYKQALVGGINDYEISVDLGFNYDTIQGTSAGNPVYVETNYWTKMPTATTTSAYGLSYDGDVVISSSAVVESWTPRAKLTITDNLKEQLRLSHTNDRYTDFRTQNIPYNGDSSFGPLASDRTVLSVDTCGEWDSLLQLGTDTSAYGIKSIAIGCKTSAGGYDSAATNAVDGGYTLATGVETLAKGFASVSFGLQTSSIGNMNFVGGYKSLAIDVDGSNYWGAGEENDGYNFAYGKETSAISTISTYTPYDIKGSGTIYGFNYAFGQKVLSTGGASYAFGSYTSATGLISKSVGSNNLASGPVSYAFGAENISTDAFATTHGYKNSASNKFSTAIGESNISNGIFSYALGQENTALKDFSYAFGQRNVSTGNLSFATGYETSSTGYTSFSFGFKTLAQGNGSIAFGTNSISLGNNSISLGTNVSAVGIDSFVVGSQSLSQGDKSVSIGYMSSAIGTKSVALGTSTEATLEDSFAIGSYSKSNGIRSVALGYQAEATKDDQVVVGSCKTDVGIYGKNIEIIGKKCNITDRTKIIISADEVEIEGYNADSTLDSFYVWVARYQLPSRGYFEARILRKRFNNASKKYISQVSTLLLDDHGGVSERNISMILFNPTTMQFVSIKKENRKIDSIYTYGENDSAWVDTNYPGYIILAASSLNDKPILENGIDYGAIMNTAQAKYYNFPGVKMFNVFDGVPKSIDQFYLNGILNNLQDNYNSLVVKVVVNTIPNNDTEVQIYHKDLPGVSYYKLNTTNENAPSLSRVLSNEQYSFYESGYIHTKNTPQPRSGNVSLSNFFSNMKEF